MKWFVLTGLVLGPNAQSGWWGDFCERNIVAEDPYQFETLSVDQLVSVYFLNKNQNFKSKALINEMKKRLYEGISPEEREILEKTLNNEK